MIREDGPRLTLEGPLTLATVAGLMDEGRRLVAAADRAMYGAKSSGRDRVAWRMPDSLLPAASFR